ncbi:M28 family peptidase [Lentiprolixibacter aurantiacus]|uniref:M28 family peptidase n=1 Tax=Lentiprolixibacter aurantiacus TaxID=2993939 RepID=A0AAE3MLI0_9FLAO|nr:M28 family peptidase [Lentiprolixibacter aurantiacus]MCX2719526.1 M28 family peptidase [Lentiprolixibacter aurantiacus]
MRTTPILILFLFIGQLLLAQSDQDKVLETVNVNSIKGHIYFLADDLLRGRETGTPENKIAASYLANAFRKYGVQPNPASGDYYQEVKLERSYPAKSATLTIGGLEIGNTAGLRVGNMSYEGDFVYAGYGLEDNYEGLDVKGKVVLIKAGNVTGGEAQRAFSLLGEKRDIAMEKGAVAVVEFIKAQDQMWGYIDHQFNAPGIALAKGEKDKSPQFTYMWVQDADGSLSTKISSKPVHSGQMKLEVPEKEAVVSYNVVGMVTGTDPELKDEFIIYSAHYDHVGIGSPDATGDTIYNGARDNAVGTTTVLSMAENLAKYPTKRSALFILFTGEEKGLLGSKYYVENPVLPLKQMVYCFNSDNGGYNDTSLTTIVGLNRTTAAEHIKTASAQFGLNAIDDPAPEQGLFDRSDNVHFARKGIPAPTFSMGFSSFDGEVTKYYHRPGDEADTMDYTYLEKFFRAYVLSGRLIADDPTTPVWTSGDKYEKAAQALYKD